LSSRNDGCNQSGGGTRDVSAMIGVGLVLGALARRKRSR
jgi:MYXO-CTERM domain-containing protein